MFRTRDLLIIVISIIFTMIVALVAVVLSPEPERKVTTSQEEVKLTTPKDSYSIAPYEEENTLRDEREAFIEKVKQTYIPPTVTLPDKADSTQSAPDSLPLDIEEPAPVQVPEPVTPVVPVPTSVNATETPYGNTRL